MSKCERIPRSSTNTPGTPKSNMKDGGLNVSTDGIPKMHIFPVVIPKKLHENIAVKRKQLEDEEKENITVIENKRIRRHFHQHSIENILKLTPKNRDNNLPNAVKETKKTSKSADDVTVKSTIPRTRPQPDQSKHCSQKGVGPVSPANSSVMSVECDVISPKGTRNLSPKASTKAICKSETENMHDVSTGTDLDSTRDMSIGPEDLSGREVGDNQELRKPRTMFKLYQVTALEQVFDRTQYPNQDLLEWLAEKLGLPENRIKVWFQNKRARWKKRSLPGGQNFPTHAQNWAEETGERGVTSPQLASSPTIGQQTSYSPTPLPVNYVMQYHHISPNAMMTSQHPNSPNVAMTSYHPNSPNVPMTLHPSYYPNIAMTSQHPNHQNIAMTSHPNHQNIAMTSHPNHQNIAMTSRNPNIPPAAMASHHPSVAMASHHPNVAMAQYHQNVAMVPPQSHRMPYHVTMPGYPPVAMVPRYFECNQQM